jgi:altronate hydrolase
VALGGKVLLAEFPELCGAEQNLLDRTKEEPVAEKFIRLMQTYSDEAQKVGSGFSHEPVTGQYKRRPDHRCHQKQWGSQKRRHFPRCDVLDYTEPARKPGLAWCALPATTWKATTGKAASGATLILFTTGLGTPTGNPVCPTIKVSTNSKLTKRMNDIIDIDTARS